MTIRLIVGGVALASVSLCGLISAFVTFEIVDLVNKKLPEKDRFDPFWWYWEKTRRLHREYKRLYPSGRLLRKTHILLALMIGCLLTCAWCFHIIE
jgi:hypothetical protein